MNNTSTILKALRIKKNITLEQLAVDLNKKFDVNITRSMLSKWETGKSAPVYNHLKHLALYYAVTTDFLLGFDHQEELTITESCSNIVNIAKKRIRNSKKYYTIETINELLESDEITNKDISLIKDFIKLLISRKHNNNKV